MRKYMWAVETKKSGEDWSMLYTCETRDEARYGAKLNNEETKKWKEGRKFRFSRYVLMKDDFWQDNRTYKQY